MSGDGYHITAPDSEGRGAALAMKLALKDADIAPDAIDYINAHGTSTELGDLAETKAVKSVLGDHAYKVAISSTKSQLGHSLGASGGVEAVISSMVVQNNLIPPHHQPRKPQPRLRSGLHSAQSQRPQNQLRHEQQLRLRRAQRHAGVQEDLRTESSGFGSQSKRVFEKIKNVLPRSPLACHPERSEESRTGSNADSPLWSGFRLKSTAGPPSAKCSSPDSHTESQTALKSCADFAVIDLPLAARVIRDVQTDFRPRLPETLRQARFAKLDQPMP